MRKYIYITPNAPNESEFLNLLAQLNPSISDVVKKNINISFQLMKQRVRDSAINNGLPRFNQKQTFSDGRHTIILVASLQEPSKLKKLLDWLNGFL
jgi:hypothetical protein